MASRPPDKHDLLGRIWAALRRIAEAERLSEDALLAADDHDGITNKEIGDVLGIGEEGARKRIKEIRRKRQAEE
jgi:hypothetical protein